MNRLVPPTSVDLAAADCGAQSAQLITVLKMETNLFVKNLLASSTANNIFIGARSDGRGGMKWMDGGNIPVTTDFSNLGHTFDNNLKTVAPGKCLAMVKGRDEWEIVDCSTARNSYICQKPQQSSNNVGFCRWDAFRANTDVKSACMCPTSMNTCAKRPNCFWYEDPNSPFKECISNSERFYNMLHRLLVRRGKKDFAIKIRNGSTPARGQMPFGPYGPSIIGAGNPNPTSMFGVYGHKNPYDRQRGMGMFGKQGHFGPQRQSQMNPWGQSLPGQSHMGYGRMPPQMMGQHGMMGQQGQQMMGQQGPQMMGQMGQHEAQMMGQMGQQGPQMLGQMGGQQGQQPWGQRQQVYHEGNRFNPYKQQNHKQY